MIASFAAGILLARGLGVEGYGFYSLALAVITIAAIPSEFGLPFLVTREVAAASAKQEYGTVFGIIRWANRASMWVAGAVALAIALAGLVLFQVGSPILAGAFLFGAPVIPLVALAKIQGGALQGLNHVVRGQVPWSLLRPLILALLVAATLFAGARLTAPAAMALNSVTAAAVLVIAYAWLRRHLPASVPAKTVEHGRRWFASSVPMGLMEGMRQLQSELALLLLGLIAAPAAVGLLRIAAVTAQTAAAPIAVIVHVALPIMARLHVQKDHARLQKTVTAVAQSQFVAVLALSLPLIMFAEPLIALAFGSEFERSGDALRIIAAGQIANAAFGPNIWVLNMTNHERRVARALAIALAATIVTVPLLSMWLGVTGAALGLLVSMLVWNVIAWRDAKRLLALETSVCHWPWRNRSARDAA